MLCLRFPPKRNYEPLIALILIAAILAPVVLRLCAPHSIFHLRLGTKTRRYWPSRFARLKLLSTSIAELPHPCLAAHGWTFRRRTWRNVRRLPPQQSRGQRPLRFRAGSFVASKRLLHQGMKEWDFRLTPARPDLAAEHLRGVIKADAYAAGRPMQAVTGVADLRRAPSHEALLDSQVLYGEEVTVYEEYEGWGWVQLARDQYVGYMPLAALDAGSPHPTHRVCVNRTFVYQCPDIKMSARRSSPLGAGVCVVATDGLFAQIGPCAYVFADHLRPFNEREEDFVAVAERFLHVPYLWGGKTSLGIDCSGLVQIALDTAGIAAPRDTDLQQRALGSSVAAGAGLADLRRGDLVFWPGHVGIMQDGTMLLHASAHHMLVVSEPLRAVRDRILAKTSQPVAAVKRLAA